MAVGGKGGSISVQPGVMPVGSAVGETAQRQQSASRPVLKLRPENAVAPAPGLLLTHASGVLTPAQCTKMVGAVDCELGTAFVELQMAFKQVGLMFEEELPSVKALLEIPQNARSTVSKCEIRIIGSDGKQVVRNFGSALLPIDDIEKMKQLKAREDSELQRAVNAGYFKALGSDFEEKSGYRFAQESDPYTFRVPLPCLLLQGETVEIDFAYFETLEFYSGNYELHVPMDFSKLNTDQIATGALAPNLVRGNVFDITIDGGEQTFQDSTLGQLSQAGFTAVEEDVEPFQIEAASRTHRLAEEATSATHSAYTAAPLRPDTMDLSLHVSYSMASERIMASLLYEEVEEAAAAPGGKPQKEQYFSLSVAPPAANPLESVFPRNIVFCIDKSLSMNGDALENAKQALMHGVRRLRPTDNFDIIDFDDNADAFRPNLIPATEDNKNLALAYAAAVEVRRLTDILKPLKLATNIIRGGHNNSSRQGDAAGHVVKPVNYVFLLTDGAVAAEREICSYVQNEMKDIRLMTFGIGPYCNPQFLRVLGILGRGFTDLSLHQELIYDQMVHMLDKASMPILTNVRMFASANPKQNNFPGIKSLYPGGLPDLYGGSPIQITGTFTGTLPPLSISGRDAHGREVVLMCTPTTNPRVSIKQVCARSAIEQLTAFQWLEEDKNKKEDLKQRVVQTSVNAQIPSMHTQQVIYEQQTPPPYSEKGGDRSKGTGKGEGEEEQEDTKPRHVRRNFTKTQKAVAAGGVAAAVGGGAIVLLAVTVGGVGDIGATTAGLAAFADAAAAGSCCTCCCDGGIDCAAMGEACCHYTGVCCMCLLECMSSM